MQVIFVKATPSPPASSKDEPLTPMTTTPLQPECIAMNNCGWKVQIHQWFITVMIKTITRMCLKLKFYQLDGSEAKLLVSTHGDALIFLCEFKYGVNVKS